MRSAIGDRLWPQTRAQTLRDQAAAAMAAGNLSAEDGHGARQLYEAALALDPDGNESRVGLAKVAQAALAQARAAGARNDFPEAHAALRLARELSVPRAQSEAVAIELRDREAERAGIDGLLKRAQIAQRAGHLLGEGGALGYYQRVLSLEPEKLEALEGREDALSDVVQQARISLSAGDLPQAAQTVAAVREYDPGHVQLPEIAAELTRAVEKEHQKAEAALRRGAVQNAGELYAALLRIDPNDARAQQGLARTATDYALRADRLIADYRFDEAQAALNQAQALQPQAPAVVAATAHLQRARQSRQRQTAAPSGRDLERVRGLLEEAAQAEARGDLLTPPGDSAYDKLRAARAIAPNHPQVAQAMQRLLPAAHDCFEKQLRNNSLARARACLDAQVALAGDNAASRQGRGRLAQRWLAVGDERLGAGDVDGAASALNAARSVEPSLPQLAEFTRRLQAATAATP